MKSICTINEITDIKFIFFLSLHTVYIRIEMNTLAGENKKKIKIKTDL